MPPTDCPARVTLSGSPLKDAMFSRTHLSDRSWSFRPWRGETCQVQYTFTLVKLHFSPLGTFFFTTTPLRPRAHLVSSNKFVSEREESERPEPVVDGDDDDFFPQEGRRVAEVAAASPGEAAAVDKHQHREKD